MMGGAEIAIDGSGMAEEPGLNSVLFALEGFPSLQGLQLRGPALSRKCPDRLGPIPPS